MSSLQAPSDALLQALLLHGGCAVCCYDAQNRITGWNALYTEFFPEVASWIQVGTTFEETLEAFLRLQHPASTPEQMAQATKNGMFRHLNDHGPIQYQRADGRWLELRMFSLPEGGRFKIWRDISTQIAPGTDSELLHRLIAAVNVGITVHDAHGGLRYVNTRFFSEHFLSLIRGLPAIERRVTQGSYWKKFHEIFERDAEFEILCLSEVEGPLHHPVTLQARSGRFYRIQEQWWEDELVSIWTDVTDVISRKRALQQAHSELSALNRQLVELSETDSLTGLANRRRFGVQLERAQQAVVEGAHAAVAIFDLDFFKAVNDRYGHDAGDVVLVEAAKMLQVHQGDDICVARLGGEEFGMVFRGMEVADVLAVCEDLRRAFSQGHFRIGAQRLRVTVSVGVAPLTESRNQSVSLKKADDSLWKAKSAGRDCVMFELSWPHVRDGVDDLQVITDILADDEPLSPEALREKYALPVNQHPVFTRPHWQDAVRRRETVDDYWGWVSYEIEARSQDQ